MNAATARSVARQIHAGQLTRFGEPLSDHVERVAHGVPEEARAPAYLHDALEHSQASADDLRACGLSDIEQSVLELLTRRPGESYDQHVLRIAAARGAAGRLARTIKLSDLEDHLRHARSSSVPAPNYGWAREQIALARAGDCSPAIDGRRLSPVGSMGHRAGSSV